MPSPATQRTAGTELGINTVIILKEKLKHIWTYRSRNWASEALVQWCYHARSPNNRSADTFGRMLDRYRIGIINHCDFPIHRQTGRGEKQNQSHQT